MLSTLSSLYLDIYLMFPSRLQAPRGQWACLTCLCSRSQQTLKPVLLQQRRGGVLISEAFLFSCDSQADNVYVL